MDFNRLHTELRRLSELVDGWRNSGQVIEIERDLALAKLRELYEALRFAHTEPVAPDSDGASASAESIDLDAVLGLASVAGAVESFAGASGPESPEAGGAEDFASVPEPVSDAASEVASAAESVSVSEEMPRTAPLYGAAATTNVGEGFASEPDSAPGPDSAPEIEEAPVPEATFVAEPGLVSESAPAVETISRSESFPAPEPAVAFEPVADSKPAAVSESENSSGAAAVSGSVPRQNPLPEPETTGAAIPPFEPAAVSGAPAVASGSFGSAGSTSAPESSEPSASAESFGHPLPQADAPAAASAASGESLPVEPQAPESVPVPDHGAKPQAEPLSLFDVEKLSVRRAKHRVVLSLYDDDEPAPKSEPRAVSHPSDRPAPQAGAVRSEPQDPAPYSEPDRTGPVEHASGIPAAAPVRESEAGEPRPASSRSASDRAAAEPLSAEREESVHHGSQPEAASPIPPQPGESHPHAAGRRPGETVVLGELLGGEVKTLGDVIASRLDPAPAVGQEPVGDLRRAICANDRFLLVRDLFAGDAEAYDAAIDRLNAFDDLDECVIYIAEHYDWNPNSEGARLLMELIERKLS